jgi:hypothetical protein
MEMEEPFENAPVERDFAALSTTSLQDGDPFGQ